MNCKYCNEKCIKKGKQSRGKQRYYCKNCNKYQQKEYIKESITKDKIEFVKKLNNEGVGISSMSRILNISKSSVQRIITKLSEKTQIPKIIESGQVYEVDELKTYAGSKKRECWITYAMNNESRKVIDFVVGRRTKDNLSKIINKLLELSPKRIYTDGLIAYKSLIPKQIHKVFKYCTNKIERNNLTLRTNLKRLSRKSICFSKSTEMLHHCLKIYVWG